MNYLITIGYFLSIFGNQEIIELYHFAFMKIAIYLGKRSQTESNIVYYYSYFLFHCNFISENYYTHIYIYMMLSFYIKEKNF